MIDLTNKTVLISRTDSIGDVVLTLPMCVWIKEKYPTSKIIFLGNTYTKPVIACIPQIDEVLEWSNLDKMPELEAVQLLKSKKIDVFFHVFPRKEIAQLAKKAKIEHRIGTSHRSFHFFTCNHRVSFSRKNSNLHESQLNFELLKPCGLSSIPSLVELTTWMKAFKPIANTLPSNIEAHLQKNTQKVILHTKSQGSAMEWPIEKYAIVADELLARGYSVYYTGTEADGVYIRSFIPNHENCLDTTGKMTLDELIYFISRCDILIACSTGPLHLSGILGLQTIGLFSTKRPIHPGRWKALGENVQIVENDEHTEGSKVKPSFNTIEKIETIRVLNLIA